jgi:hypothetical protein
MPWNEKDFTRWRAQSYARLGIDTPIIFQKVNGTTTFLTVPANHEYLIRGYSSQIINTSAVSERGYALHRRGAVDIFCFCHVLTASIITTQQFGLTFPYPMSAIAGDMIILYSSAAALTVILSLSYTDVDLTTFPAYDPGY